MKKNKEKPMNMMCEFYVFYHGGFCCVSQISENKFYCYDDNYLRGYRSHYFFFSKQEAIDFAIETAKFYNDFHSGIFPKAV